MKKLLLIVTFTVVLLGCRGNRDKNPPIHFNPNLDWQEKVEAQRMPLQPPDNTVAWGRQSVDPDAADRAGFIKSDRPFYYGAVVDTQWVTTIPVNVTSELMQRGQQRFNIYCAVCHDQAGTGKGPVVEKGFTPAPRLDHERVLAYPDGKIFDIVTNGIRTMPGYAKQIPEADRWAIVSYVRALQKMYTTTAEELTPEQMAKIK